MKIRKPKFEYTVTRNPDGTVAIVKKTDRRSSEYAAWIALRKEAK